MYQEPSQHPLDQPLPWGAAQESPGSRRPPAAARQDARTLSLPVSSLSSLVVCFSISTLLVFMFEFTVKITNAIAFSTLYKVVISPGLIAKN